MSKAATFFVLTALCSASMTVQAAPAPLTDQYTTIGMIYQKSWDGPHWWQLHSQYEQISVRHAVARAVRSDLRGYDAFIITLQLVNTSLQTAGRSGLVLRAAEELQAEPANVAEPDPDPWVVGTDVRVHPLAPGESIEVSIAVYRARSSLRAPETSGPVAFALTEL